MKSYKKIIPFILTMPLLFSCNNGPKYNGILLSSVGTFIQTTTNQLVNPFDTDMTIAYYKDKNEQKYQEFDQELKDSFVSLTIDLHSKFDRHYSYYQEDGKSLITNVKTVNDSYGTGQEIFCSEELYNLLKLGYRLTIETNGVFNFYMGKLTSYWDNILSNCSTNSDNIKLMDPIYNLEVKNKINNYVKAIPTIDEIKNIMTFNDEKLSVVFNKIEDKEGLDRDSINSEYRPEITSGGIAKGLATDYIKQALLEKNYRRGYLNSGRSSITSLSDDLFQVSKSQSISITDPRYQVVIFPEVVAKINLNKDYTLSTSGTNTYEKSYYLTDPNTNELIKRHHIVNPETGEPSLYHSSVTIISHTFNNGEMDALSTAIVNLPSDKIGEFRNNLLSIYPNHDLSILLIDTDKNNNLIYNIYGELKDNIEIMEGEINETHE